VILSSIFPDTEAEVSVPDEAMFDTTSSKSAILSTYTGGIPPAAAIASKS
jgi:adenine/guanine phosphoribosyltransferase-like PRPP-binding protein